MLRNYIKIAFRNLIRYKSFSFLNIAGLATGMACSILILLWVQDERNYDRFHTQADRIFRITSQVNNAGYAVVNYPLAAAMQTEMPEIKQIVRLQGVPGETLMEVGDLNFEEKGVLYADSTFLQVFSFPLVNGDPKAALNRPDGIVITERIAKKYFGSADAIGKTIRIKQTDNVTVTAVLQDVPANSHLQFDFLLPMSLLARSDFDIKNNAWGGFNFYGYVQLAEQIDPLAALARLEERAAKIFQKNFKEFPATFKLQPLSGIHLQSKLQVDLEGHGNIQYVRIFALVAVFILLVACINFMNLSTARSARRSKEVGLRKVIGADRKQLVGQFLGESLFISFLALLVAVVLVKLALPVFNDLAGKELALHILDARLFPGLLLICLLTGVLSGSYPALYLSGFKAITVLKGGVARMGRGGVFFRSGLVVIQFVVSIVLIVSTVVVYQQLQFMKTKNLGYSKENLLYLPLKGDLTKNIKALQAELSQSTLANDFSVVSALPTGQAYREIDIVWEGKAPDFKPVFSFIDVDEHFLDKFKVSLLAGRGFSKSRKADSVNYLVNEKALSLIGLNLKSAVGKPISMNGNKGTIIGVIKDFNFRTVQQSVEPLLLRYNSGYGNLVIRTKPSQLEPTISYLEQVCKKLNPGYTFSYGFIDQDLANLYRSEQRMGRIFKAFALLAIFIACLGLYGLAAFTAEQRTKEIGVRKVLGASVANVAGLLSKDFVKLVSIAILIASPLAWYGMSKWLQDFAYSIEIKWVPFVLAGVAVLVIALITVSFQAIKAAIANPVKSLRSE